MLVLTANKFLMNEFSQGRLSLDTMKKVSDAWKNKGRPAVVEFQYDQSTQRELISANQRNVRFHGFRASDQIRISAMLYSWKQAGPILSLHTFCTPDTVFMKLLFDVGQILEFLGATDTLSYRMQQLRAESSERIRMARLEQASKEVPAGNPRADKKGSFSTNNTASFSSSSSSSKPERSAQQSFSKSMRVSDNDIEKTLL